MAGENWRKSRLHLEGLPGNVRLSRSETGVTKASVANVYDVQKVLKADFERPVGRLSVDRVRIRGTHRLL